VSVARLPIVGVMGGNEVADPQLCAAVGRAIAEAGCHLLTGAGRGAMTAVAAAFTAISPRAGRSIGIARAHVPPNPFVEIPIITHLPDSGKRGKLMTSRNHINVLSSDLVIALPGEAGTRSEVDLALEYDRPLVLFLGRHTIDGASASELLAHVPHARATIAASIDDIVRCITALI